MPTGPRQQDVFSVEAAAIRLLAGREHSVAELRGKLCCRFTEGGLVERVLQDLQKRGLLSDQRFTEQFVQQRIRKGFGPLRIRADLLQRGIEGELIDEWLDAVGSDWSERLHVVARQRFGDSSAEDRKEQARRARFLQYRGFPENLIRRYLWD